MECEYCGEKGASVICLKSKNCKKKYHLPCAFKAKCVFFRDKTILCRNCLENSNAPDLSLIHILKDFKTNRRLYIVDSHLSNEKDLNRKNKSSGIIEKTSLFQAGTYNKFGSLTILNIFKEEPNESNSNTSGGIFDEYLFVKNVTVSSEKRLLLFLLHLNKKQYYINSKLFTITEFNTLFEENKNEDKKGNFIDIRRSQVNQFFSDFYQKANKIEDLYTLWEHLSEKTMISIHSIPVDYITDFVSRFMGMDITLVKKWLKVPTETFQFFKKNAASQGFLYYFYQKALDENNPFEKHEIIQKIHTEMMAEAFMPKINSQEPQVHKNPKNLPLKNFTKITMSKENKPKREERTSIADYNIKVDEIVSEPKLFEAAPIVPLKIQTEKEFERKLKHEYAIYKKRAAKGVIVAPSNIHKYGLFATNKFLLTS